MLTIALNNSFYQQWGLLGVVLIALGVLISFIRWFEGLDTDRTLAARLQIVEALVGMFQKTVREEAIRIIEIIDEHLPTALSQAENPLAQPSAFDSFCQKIRDLDESEFDREVVRSWLNESLSGIVLREVNRHIELDSEPNNTPGDGTGLSQKPAFRSGFEAHTQRKLRLLAEKSVQAKKKENKFHLGKRWVPRLWVATVVSLMLFIPSPFSDTLWAFRLGGVAFGLFVGGVITGACALLIFCDGKNWLEEQSNLTSEDWFAELSQSS